MTRWNVTRRSRRSSRAKRTILRGVERLELRTLLSAATLPQFLTPPPQNDPGPVAVVVTLVDLQHRTHIGHGVEAGSSLVVFGPALPVQVHPGTLLMEFRADQNLPARSTEHIDPVLGDLGFRNERPLQLQSDGGDSTAEVATLSAWPGSTELVVAGSFALAPVDIGGPGKARFVHHITFEGDLLREPETRWIRITPGEFVASPRLFSVAAAPALVSLFQTSDVTSTARHSESETSDARLVGSASAPDGNREKLLATSRTGVGGRNEPSFERIAASQVWAYHSDGLIELGGLATALHKAHIVEDTLEPDGRVGELRSSAAKRRTQFDNKLLNEIRKHQFKEARQAEKIEGDVGREPSGPGGLIELVAANANGLFLRDDLSSSGRLENVAWGPGTGQVQVGVALYQAFEVCSQAQVDDPALGGAVLEPIAAKSTQWASAAMVKAGIDAAFEQLGAEEQSEPNSLLRAAILAVAAGFVGNLTQAWRRQSVSGSLLNSNENESWRRPQQDRNDI